METNNMKSKIVSIISIVLIAILGLVLVINMTIIIKGAVNPDEPPSIFGVTPLVVTTGSMKGDEADCFDAGSLIFVMKVGTEDLDVGDVIAFYDPASSKGSLTTHRITEVLDIAGETFYKTKGDFNNRGDDLAVSADSVVGKYFFHLEGMGSFALFLQGPVGMLVFIGLPVMVFLVYELLRRRVNNDKRDSKTAELEAEIERLRALAKEQEEKSEKQDG